MSNATDTLHSLWHRHPGGRWRRVASGTRAQCARVELELIHDARATNVGDFVVLAAGKVPWQSDPPEPPPSYGRTPRHAA